MKVEFHGTPNYQRFAETWAAIIAAKEGMEVVPGSVKVTLKGDTHESLQGIQQGHDVPWVSVQEGRNLRGR